jgi:N-acetyl sugar amidotransferase
MKWCRSCVLPDTRPHLVIGADGICNACRSHGTKRAIDWTARRDAFAKVVEHAKSRSAGYDCVIPVSGGKDSTWQVAKCAEDYGLRILAVTWRTPGRTAVGQANLDNLRRLGERGRGDGRVDHVDFSIDPEIERIFMLRALERKGDPAIPMHMAIFSIPLMIAVRFQVPLVIWGENSAFEYGGSEEESKGFALDEAWVRKYGVTHGTSWRDWLGEAHGYCLSESMLAPYRGPSDAELSAAGVKAVFLGYYFEWDPGEIADYAISRGFKKAATPKTGYYDYADIDDDFISVHHWFKWYKFGFTRLFDNLSIEIRNGRMSRDRAIAVIRERGDQTPHDDIRKMCAFLRYPPEEFFAVAENFRNRSIWQKQGGKWMISDFLIPDWPWQ